MAGAYRQVLGNAGESLACAELVRRGLTILDRRYRTRHGEIDIVARDGETVVFVEVKARLGAEWGSGADAVTPWKRRRIGRMAEDYLARHRWLDRPARFDVIAIEMDAPRPAVTVYPHAFTLDD